MINKILFQIYYKLFIPNIFNKEFTIKNLQKKNLQKKNLQKKNLQKNYHIVSVLRHHIPSPF